MMNAPKKDKEQKQRSIVGIRIRYLRESIPMSQQAFAEELGVTRAAVCQWENGETTPSLNTLRAMKQKFGVSIDALLDETEPPEGAMIVVKGFLAALQELGGETNGGDGG